MSQNKLNLSDLFQELAEKSGISKTTAELFAKTFFAQIEEGLLQDGIVKINGFGTFKAQWNEPRKSININTGEEIIIPAHPRISFTPDTAIKERINEPFAYLQPTSIGQATSENNTQLITPNTEDTDNEIESIGDTLQKINDDADEIKALLCDINGTDWMNTNTTTEQNETNENPQATIEQPEEKEVEESTTNEQPVEEIKVEEENNHTDHTEEPTQENSIENTTTQSTSKNTFWKVFIGIAATVCLLCVGAYFYMTYRVQQWAENKIAEATQVEQTPAEETNTNTDTTQTNVTTEEEPTVNIENPTEENTLQLPTSYQDFIDTTQLNEGSRLAWLAKKYYGSADFWVYIYEANKDIIPDPNNIPVGTTIKIPKLPQNLIDPNNDECIQLAKELHKNILNK